MGGVYELLCGRVRLALQPIHINLKKGIDSLHLLPIASEINKIPTTFLSYSTAP